MLTNTCTDSSDLEACRDEKTAFILKLIAIASILLAGIIGVAVPLIGKNWRLLRTDSSFFSATKAFAAGVILATGFVHMLPDSTSALTDPCLPKIPWSNFPFSGFIAMMAALATMIADFISTQYYQNKHEIENLINTCTVDDNDDLTSVPLIVKEEGEIDNDNDTDSVIRNVVVSQVLELGIVSHSIIIGLSLGVSQSPCTIRPLIGALSLHQFFEGFALAGCISQARFGILRSTLMASFFAITAPISVAIGTGISSFYNPNSPRALVIEGVLDSISAGILIYMALVDLIAAEFLSKRMKGSLGDQVVSFIALFLGAGLMASLAAWA